MPAISPSHRLSRSIWILLSVILTPLLAAQSPQSLHYSIDAKGASAAARVIPLEVTLELQPPTDRTVFAIPVWTPGSYRLRDFPERITPLAATADERDVPIEPLARGRWQVRHGSAASLRIRYRVELHADDRFMDPSPQRRCITYEGPAVYTYVEGLLHAPCRVDFILPEGWQAASGLDPAPDHGFTAADYDVLADCPVKLGRFQRFTFQSHGVPIEAVLDGGSDLEFDQQRWLRGLQAIVDHAGDVFGGLPFAHYSFLYTASAGGGGGGLEHLTSTAIGLGRARFVRDPSSSFSVSAHEFFHVWNVKRLRPIELGPFTYDRPDRTTGLWLSEGVTSYYGPLVQTRAGLIPPASFWRSMASAIARYESFPGRRFTSSEQASLRVWDKQPPDRVVDYYTSGQVLGLLLDLQIRHATNGSKSLDDAMRALYAFCVQNGRGVTADEIASIVSATAGTDLTPFFDAHVRGTQVPDYATILGYAGRSCTRTERRTQTVLRGANLLRADAPAFADYTQLEHSGGGEPLAWSGRIRQIGDDEVATATDVDRLVKAAAAAGTHSVKVTYELGNGTRRTVHAALEQRTDYKVEIEPRDDASALSQQIGEQLTASKRR